MNITQRVRAALRPIASVRHDIERVRYRIMGSKIEDDQSGNFIIRRAIEVNKPSAIGKIGAAELGGVRRYLGGMSKDGVCRSWGRHRLMLYRNAGVFPDDDVSLSDFCRCFISDCAQLTVAAAWYQWGESDYVSRFLPTARLVSLKSLEPYYHSAPWSSALENKRVLVVSPFSSTIVNQYGLRDKIWRGREDVLPEFFLQTLRCPMSAGIQKPIDSSWMVGLQRMRDQMAGIDFDVALVGAGAWSIPLAVHAKRLGKIGIHLGGSTQILFGIKGGRWDNHSQISKLFNEHWVRPSQEDTPAAASTIEGGCYW